MSIKYLKPTIQWVGGKSRLLTKIKEDMPSEYNRYFEVFLGGGAVLVGVLPKNAICYELNSILCNLYNIIKSKPEVFIEKLKKIEKIYLEKTQEERKLYYYTLRTEFNKTINIVNDSDIDTQIENAVYFKIINKVCFNAVYRVNSKGIFNVPFGNGRDCVICDTDTIMNMSAYFNDNAITINNNDFEESLKDIKEGDFVYIDPPYYPLKENSFTSYTKNGFNKKDHERLVAYCKTLHSKKVKFMLSNSNCDFIKNHFSDEAFTIKELSISRTLNSNKNGRKKTKCEIIIKNY